MNYKISDIISSSLIEITKDNVSLDDTLLGVDFGTALTIFPSVDFGIATDGAVWATFKKADVWTHLKDINFQIVYNLNATDNAKNVRINVKTWATDTGELPTSTQDASYNETIVSAASNTNKLTILTCTIAKVALASMTANTKYITIKITRDNSVASNYGGTFQLISVKTYQV
jgi:hypothetical protein